ncbi:MAG: aldo/keto reductase [Candidatus Methylomirabilales bacterium]
MGQSGFATSEGTAAYRERVTGRVAREHFREGQGLILSSIGLGTYLGSHDTETDGQYREAARTSLELGCNVIDTAINYRCQRSERIIGEVIAAWTSQRGLRREEVVVATKGGFLPFDGEPPANLATYVLDTFIRPGIVRPEEIVAGCHCLTPQYLQHQLRRSQENLQLDCVDIYYLHNPETQLQEVPREEFHRRMQAAFEVLEAAVNRGAIRAYGTATWTGYRNPSTAQDYLSLEALVKLAEEVAGKNHHLRVIQLPFNLAMPEALVRRNQPVDGETVSILEAASHFEVTVMASAPIYQGQLSRSLPPVIGRYLQGLETDAQRAIQFVRSTPGVTTVLVGMKQRRHVEENLRVAQLPPAPLEEFLKLFGEEE